MRRERKREETERRFLTRQQGLRERRQRKQNPSPVAASHDGGGPAASDHRASLGRYGNASPTESRVEAAGTYSGGK
jgi:hypothetical protein